MKLLTFAMGAAATGTFTSCSRCGGPADEHLPYAVWREIRTALRTSPDHLPARAEELVAAGDPAALFHFVRDQIATYPSDAYSTEATRAVRWGTRGTLRGGAGTPREKAELLAELYRRAGLEAEVLQGQISIPEQVVKQLYWRTPDRPFAPEISDRKMEEWRERLQSPEESTFTLPRIDQGGVESRRLAERLSRSLPEEQTTRQNFDWRWKGQTPIVRVRKGAVTHYANLFSPATPFGEAGVDPKHLRPGDEADEVPPVEITLSAALAASPEDRLELVSGSWSLAQLVGRQVIVQMLPGLDLRRQAVSTFRDVQTFIPALAIQGFDLDKSEMEELSVIGDAISRAGERFHVAPDGTVSINGRSLASPKSTASAEAVAALDIEIDSARYPSIRIRANARDASGGGVEGLVASDFRIEEDGRSVGFVMSANRAAPRIEFLSDASSSMPPEYRGKGMEELVAGFTKRIRAEHPYAEVRPQPTNSELWEWLARAASTNANLIIYATDGHVEGELTDEIRAILAQGPPVVVINVRNYPEDNGWYKRTFAPMAQATNGTVFSVTEPAEAETAILGYLRGLELPAYNFRYGAPSDDPGERKVSISTADGRVTAAGSYIAPDAAAPSSELCGLYLSVRIGRQSSERTLAGYDPIRHAGSAVTDAMLDETLGTCFGSHYLSFEAAAPPFSVWLDDVLSAKLSIESLDRDLRENADLETLESHVKQGFNVLPAELFLQALPLHEPVTDRSLTYENGPRVMLHQTYPIFNTDRVIRHFDILPFTDFSTAAEQSEEAFRITMEKTARFAVAEATLYPLSTRSLLADEPLVELRELQRAGSLDPAMRELWARWTKSMENRDYKLVAADGSSRAFWSIDRQTGAILGILPDGSGGGTQEERIKKQLKEIDEIMSHVNQLMGMAASKAGVNAIGGLALGIVAAYGQLLTRLYAAASLAIAIMDASGIEKTVAVALQEFACNVMKTTLAAAAGDWGEKFTGLDYLIGAIGGDENNPFSCS